MKTSQKIRNSNIEVLRVISMLMIVTSHFFLYTGLYGIRPYMGMIFGSFGKLGVNVFVIISAYYLVKSNFKFIKILKLWLQVFFYSVMIGIVCLLLKRVEFDIHSVLIMLTPISYSQYWFASTYMFLYFIFPFINKFINHLNQREYKTLLIILTILLSCIYSVILESNFFDADGHGTFTWFIYLYLCGGYIRIYGIPYFNNKKSNKVILLLSFIMLSFVSVVLYLWHSSYYAYYYKLNSIFMVVIAISMLYLFINMKPFFSKTINYLGKLTFPVYLIHENLYIRTILWNKISLYIGPNVLSIVCLLSLCIIMVFIIALIVEYFQNKLVQLIFRFKVINNLCSKLDKMYNTVEVKG